MQFKGFVKLGKVSNLTMLLTKSQFLAVTANDFPL